MRRLSLNCLCEDADAFSIASSSAQSDNILHLSQRGGVVALTGGAEFLINSQGPLTPASAQIDEHTSYGVQANVKPCRVGNELLFVQRGGERLRAMSYRYEVDGLVSPELSQIAPHIPENHAGIKELTFQQTPNSIVWIVMGDGAVSSITLNRDQEMNAWSQHDFGGQVLSICALPTGLGEDQCFMLTNRNGSTVLEEFSESAQSDCEFDINVTNGVGSILNLDIQVLDNPLVNFNNADGYFYSTYTVSGTNINLSNTDLTQTVHLGQPFKTEIDLLQDADAFSIASSSAQSDNILHLSQRGGVVALTGGAEFLINSQGPLTPASAQIDEHTSYGVQANVKPCRVGNELLFVQRGGERLRAMSYRYEVDGLVSPELSQIAPHIPENHAGIKELTFQQTPNSIVWIVMGDGAVSSITLNRDQEMNAWSQHDFGGQVLSICALPTGLGEDQCFMLTNRNGSTVLEEFSESAQSDCEFDINVTNGVGSILNLDIQVLDDPLINFNNADGYFYSTYTIDGTNINLSNTDLTQTVHLGQPFKTEIDLLVEAEQLDEQTVRIIVTDELDKQLPRKVPKLVSDQIANPNSTISRSLTENTTARRNR